MRATEFMRKLTDLIATVEGEDGDNEIQDDNTGTFVPPLQASIELQKKEAGVKSVYDGEEEATDRSEENRQALVGGNE